MMRWQRQLGLGFVGLVCVGLLVLALQGACQRRDRSAPPAQPMPAPAATVQPRVVSTPGHVAPEQAQDRQPQRRQLPAITSEPQVAILLKRSSSLSIDLLQTAQSSDGRRLPSGRLQIATQGSRIAVSGRSSSDPVSLHFQQAGATFKVGSVHYSGELVVAAQRGQVVLLERLPMERYLTGVLAKEVEPDWPLESLKAQAVAARSYATARWLTRHDKLWQLDASEQVDMAYAGYIARPHPRLAAAVKQTRGDLLWYAGQPLPAFFYAASGGHTESLKHVWPKRTSPDGLTSPAPAMPAKADPWDQAGRQVAPRRLGAWRIDLPLRTVRIRLHNAGHKQVGVIEDIRLTERDATSGRARRLRIRWSGGHLDLTSHQFRMAMGSTKVKSTLWRDFRLSGDTLIVQGHGYGHGVGLAQASAWAMAKQGKLAPDILRFFYAGADLVRKW